MLAIVPRRVGPDSVDVFVGGFLSHAPPPAAVLKVDGIERERVKHWSRIDGGRAEPIFCWSRRLERLHPGQRYELSLDASNATLASATVETLPARLPDSDRGSGEDRPFTIWLSSCYSVRNSPEGLGRSIEARRAWAAASSA
jgi:hypothetical protein